MDFWNSVDIQMMVVNCCGVTLMNKNQFLKYSFIFVHSEVSMSKAHSQELLRFFEIFFFQSSKNLSEMQDFRNFRLAYSKNTSQWFF